MDLPTNAGDPGAPATPPPAQPAPVPPPSAPPAPAPVTPPPAPPAPKPAAADTFTQAEVSKIAAKEKNDARRALLEELGVTSLDDAKAILAAKRAEDEAAMTEAERLKAQAARDAAEAAEAAARAAAELRDARIVRALSLAGITDETQQAELIPMVAAKVTDEVDAVAAVEQVKATFPQLFAAPAAAVASPPPSGDVRNPTPAQPTGLGGAWERGAAQAEADKQRAGVGFNPETFRLGP